MEEMLNIKDLMVNDIVLAEAIWYDEEGKKHIEYHPFRITGISPDKQLYNENGDNCVFLGNWLDNCDAEKIGEIKPMPLTPEILQANGFEDRQVAGYQRKRDKLAGRHLTYYFEKGTLVNGVPIIDDDINLITGINNVHELQDALRVYKLKTLANNFKIK